MDSLYENIGGKIKKLAFGLFLFYAVASVIFALVYLFQGGELIIGLLILVLGPVFSFIGSWILFAFGQLVENSDILVKNAFQPRNQTAAKDDALFKGVEFQSAPLSTGAFYCKSCGQPTRTNPCSCCHKESK